MFPNCYTGISKNKIQVPSEEELPVITEGSPARIVARREELIYDLYLSEEHP